MEQTSLNNSFSQNLLNNLPGVLFKCYYSNDWIISYISPSCFALTAYQSEELVNTAFDSIISPQDKEKLSNYILKKLQDRTLIECECRIVKKDGSIQSVSLVANALYSEAGDLTTLEGYISRITEIYKSSSPEEPIQNLELIDNSGGVHLEQSTSGNKIVNTLLNAIPDSLLMIELNGKCTLFNGGAKNSDELIESKTKVVNYFPPDVGAEILFYSSAAISENRIVNYEYNVASTSGVSYYEARLIKSNDSEVLCIVRDISDITRAKEGLKLAKEFYESIIDNVNIDIAVFDEQNRYQLVNKAAVNDDEIRKWLLGKNDFDYCARRGRNIEIAESRTEMYNLANQLRRPIEWIEELTEEGGRKRYYVRTLKPLPGPGNEKYKIGYGVDITALKVIQNELLRREHLLSFSHKLAKVGYWVWYPSNRKHEWSSGVFEILEQDKKHLSPSLSAFINFVHPDDRENFKQTISLSNKSNTSYSIEYRIVTKSGRVKYIKEQSSSRRADSDSKDYHFGVVQDITEMKKSQDALAKSEEHFRAIAESSPIHILEICDKFTITYININIEAHRNEIIGTSVLEFVSPEYRELVKERLEKVSSEATIENMQAQGQGVGTSLQWYDLTIGPVKNDFGKVQSLILLAQNITDKKQSEQERERLIKEINNRYNELMQFNYIVSHNLRSPIANILGMSYILKPETSPEDVKMIFGYIIQSAESIDALIRDLNDILTARSPLNEKRENFRLSDIVIGVCSNLEQQVNYSEAIICLDISEEADELTSIKSYVQSIIHNLVSNAIKYKAVDRRPHITIKARRELQQSLIEVSDNGIGIDLKQYGQQIFGLYKRFTMLNEGKGLGLHMTKAQVESLGGSISVESEPGVGSCFRIIFSN